jgi:hypothetical protein
VPASVAVVADSTAVAAVTAAAIANQFPKMFLLLKHS